MIDAIRPNTVAQLMRGIGDQQFGGTIKDVVAKATAPVVRAGNEATSGSGAVAGVDVLATTRAEHAVGMRRAALLRPH